MKEFTLVVPYYRAPLMLREQLRLWEAYPPEVRFIVVDDGSPEPAKPVIQQYASELLRLRIVLYRIQVDLPWNRSGARNLGASETQTDWLVHVDTDHGLPPPCAARLLMFEPNPKNWYRFERFRMGTADDTRQKDDLLPHVPFGKIKPHIDSYLVTKKMFWQAGGYNEDFTGCLGGGSPFLAELAKVGGAAKLLPGEIHLHVYTQSVIADASVRTLSRDREEYAKRKAAMRGNYRGKNPLRFKWAREAL